VCHRDRTRVFRWARTRPHRCTHRTPTTGQTTDCIRASASHTFRKRQLVRPGTPALRTGPIRSCRRKLASRPSHKLVSRPASTRAAPCTRPTLQRHRFRSHVFVCRNARKRGSRRRYTFGPSTHPSDNRHRRSAGRPYRKRAFVRPRTRPRSRSHRTRSRYRLRRRAAACRTCHTT
jgi:hypothetical protein